MITSELLKNQIKDPQGRKKVTDFLCSGSGSHDYTLNGKEAKNKLGLNILEPTEEQYGLIKAIYDDINNELQLNISLAPPNENNKNDEEYILLESIKGGSDRFGKKNEGDRSLVSWEHQAPGKCEGHKEDLSGEGNNRDN